MTYRFSLPDQPLVLPQSYGTGAVIRIPMEPKTVGDYIRKRRLGLKLFQKDVAEEIGVDTTTGFNWEANLPAGFPVHAGDHPFPGLQSVATGEVHGRAAGPAANRPRAHPEGIGEMRCRGPQHVGEVGTRGEGAAGCVPGAGDAVPQQTRRSLVGRSSSDGVISAVPSAA